MIAVVKIGGHQAIVKSGEQIEVDKINEKEGKTIRLDALLISSEDGSDCQIGTPLLSTKISAKILKHGRGKKIRVFKMKPRKRYRRTRGHRQDYTVLEIGKIGSSAGKKQEKATSTEKKEVKKKPVKESTSKTVRGSKPKKTEKKNEKTVRTKKSDKK